MNGLLLVNLGTPEAPTTSAVRRYLREFLADPRVVDLPYLGRMALLYAIILPFRSPRSAHAYQRIWNPERGSPLLFHSQDLRNLVAQELGQTWEVRLAMRYGRPDLDVALTELETSGCTRIYVLPLYPHHASSSTGSTVEAVYRAAASRPAVPNLTILPEFYDHPGFISSLAEILGPELDTFQPDHLLLSYHGVPEHHVQATELAPGGHCLRSEACCFAMDRVNLRCYRAQCFATSRALATTLGLDPTKVLTAFQSRLGRVPWIRPYTDQLLAELPEPQGKRILVACPSFVVDCLETLEEVGIGLRERFAERGGELRLVPCLNALPSWGSAVATMVRQAAQPLR
jgi:ferrochelatase